MPSVGAVTSNLNITSQTVNYTAKANDFVLADATTAAVTVTLPAGPVVNTIVAVKKVDTTTSAVSVVPTSPAKIDGDTAVVLAAQGSAVSVQFDGTNWAMLSTAEVNTASTIAGIPTGGTQGQVLTKNTATNYDASWGAVSGLPTGGTAGQVLTKNSPTAGDASWATNAATGGGGMFYPWAGTGRAFVAPPVVASVAAGTPIGAATFPSLFPVRIPNACTLASISIIPNGANSSGVYLGIYTDVPTATSGGPGVRLGGGSAALTGNFTPTTVPLGGLVISQGMNVWVSLGMSASAGLICHGTAPTTFPMPQSMIIGGPGTFKQNVGSAQLPNCRQNQSVDYTSVSTDMSANTTVPTLSAAPLFIFTLA